MGHTLIINHAAERARGLALVRRALELTMQTRNPPTPEERARVSALVGKPASSGVKAQRLRDPEVTDVGPDPVKWIERLRDVNTGSDFTRKQKALIDDTFMALILKLVLGENCDDVVRSA